ncbi:unnamed protein product [Zymoseptoria tritici ST99CH_3D7]|uniref:Large ribosomal subunit protein mL59 domain-containing protein n=3 Tax=Zymoseptoria tritici TaxID=1047171 RepID=F9XEQ1_ZYMTI|nr:uncharacterized protein MYCGRDRAFT_105063 [Zymoseptoria tritici IPO323]EGP86248.1 hypothetical protein MYCGRDRAFT_105063 [Zymoseptoria tritici IPO323]SMQ52222.1 unnamed protein product [Zymoseptoria tritici ST99CH_3D7]SMR55048.1 unnamed protein product [Zymoseptoria tritici ST99CH_1E4]
MERHIQLAQRLPPRLLRFFEKFPPQFPKTAATRTGATQQTTSPQIETVTIAENTSSSDPNIGASTTTISLERSTSKPAKVGSQTTRNPFLPHKNPRTGAWHGPAFSLRRQAEIFKLAAKHNVLPLMPVSPKHPEIREQKRIDNGLRVQGTGVGKKVKGKLWERQLRGKLEERRKAMENMPKMIQEWKERGHGRGWKKWPK